MNVQINTKLAFAQDSGVRVVPHRRNLFHVYIQELLCIAISYFHLTEL